MRSTCQRVAWPSAAGFDDEVTNGARGQNLTGLSQSHDSGGEIDGPPGHIAAASFNGSELRFTGRGEQELKGVPERWSLYALDQ